MEMEAAAKEAEAEPSSAVQGRWVWKQVFEPWLPPPSAAHPLSERSAGAESEEPVLKRPRLEATHGGCWFRGDATQAEGMASRSLSYSEITDRLSSTSENPQAANRTPTPDSASAKHMICERLEDQTCETRKTHVYSTGPSSESAYLRSIST